MEKEGVKFDDLYDWEKSLTDLSTAITTESMAALQHCSLPESKMPNMERSNTHSSHDKHKKKKHEHVLEQNKLNKAEGNNSCFFFLSL